MEKIVNLKLKSFNGFSDGISPSAYNPLLLVKDFNSKGKIKIDNSVGLLLYSL